MGLFSAVTSFVGIGSKIAGTLMSAKGQRDSGNASQAALAYQASVARNNAVLSDKANADAIVRGKQQIGQKAIEARRFIGRQRVALAANGVLVDSGSALDLTVDTARFAQLDFMQLQENAAREALGFQIQGENFRKEANLVDQQGRFVGDTTDTNVAITLLTGAGSVASKWFDAKNAGVFG